MSDYYATARTNYFYVKSPEDFKTWVNTVPDIEIINPSPSSELVGLISTNDHGWPTSLSFDDDDCVEFDVIQGVSEHLREGQVAVFLEVGNEKLRRLEGFAEAVDHTGKTVTISLGDIYAKAEEAFGVYPSWAEG